MHRAKRLMRNIGAAICFILSIPFIFMTILTFTSEVEGKGVAITLSIIFILLGYFLKAPSQYSEEMKKKKDELGIIGSSVVHHVEGLPIAEKTRCEINLTLEQLIIEGGGTTFSIGIEKIRAAEIKTDTEIANIVHSSAVKGIVGGLVFGPIGLVVGSRATNKEKKTIYHYLILNYTNQSNEIATLMFEANQYLFQVQKIVNKMSPLIKNNSSTMVNL